MSPAQPTSLISPWHVASLTSLSFLERGWVSLNVTVWRLGWILSIQALSLVSSEQAPLRRGHLPFCLLPSFSDWSPVHSSTTGPSQPPGVSANFSTRPVPRYLQTSPRFHRWPWLKGSLQGHFLRLISDCLLRPKAFSKCQRTFLSVQVLSNCFHFFFFFFLAENTSSTLVANFSYTGQCY